MCGISGIFDLAGRRDLSPRRLHAMNDTLIHRGPDGGGVHLAPGVALGHRRLAIIDVASGQQPLLDETGRICVVFNGEIYNFQPLMRELESRGHRFRTRCDTEVIVHGWREWGEACLDRFNGMFAFALWDAAEDTLFLARDRLGEKPLYHAETADGLLLFGSELRAVVAGLEAVPDLEPRAVEDYFAFGYVPDPKTIFRGVQKLEPGHKLVLRRRGSGAVRVSPARYWDVRFEDRLSGRSRGLAAELADRVDRAVRLRLVSDVPLGAFLSGGVDSSAVVASMAGAQRESGGAPVQTCSIGFAEAAHNESAYAAQVAGLFGTDHFTETVDVDAGALIDRIAVAYTEPFADNSALPTYLLSGLARRRVTVALSGDGGDEVFAGYRRLALHAKEEAVKRLLPDGIRRPMFGLLGRAYPKLDWAPRVLRAKATFEALAEDAPGGYFRGVTFLPTPLRRRIYAADFAHALGGYGAVEVLRAHAARAGTTDPVARAQYIDLKTWLAGGMLVKVDRASMAHGLEVRAPLLDPDLVEWAAGLPASAKIRGMEGKAILKQALEPRLPREILYRSKQGFSVPLRSWMRHAFADRLREVIDGPVLAETGIFDRTALRRLATQHVQGRFDHSRTLWALLMFDAFLRRPWLASEGERVGAAA